MLLEAAGEPHSSNRRHLASAARPCKGRFPWPKGRVDRRAVGSPALTDHARVSTVDEGLSSVSALLSRIAARTALRCQQDMATPASRK